VPRWAGGITAHYDWALSGQWRANVGAGVRYVGEQWTFAPSPPSPVTAANTRNPAYTVGDLHAGLSNDRFSINLFVRNLTDERVYLNQTAVQDPFTANVTAIKAVPLEPRTIGISVDAKF
jgi:iron complex outermembrane receptor protein